MPQRFLRRKWQLAAGIGDTNGRTHLAHKAGHAVDLDTGAVVPVTLQSADPGDTTTLDETLCAAGMAVAEQVGREAELRPDEAPIHLLYLLDKDEQKDLSNDERKELRALVAEIKATR